MKTILLFIILSITFLNCSKTASSSSSAINNGNNSGSGGTSSIYHDSTLLFAINVSSSGFSDSSMYKNAVAITNSPYDIVSINGQNCIEFATDPVEESSNSQQLLPYLSNNLPLLKTNNSLTFYIEFKNSLNTASSGIGMGYNDTASYFCSLCLGTFNSSEATNAFEFGFERDFTKNYRQELNWTGPNDVCGYQNSNYSNLYFTKNILISTTAFDKIVIVIDQDIISIYYNNKLIIQSANQFPISLNHCNNNNSSVFSVIKGTILKNFKVWNRALSQTEINNL